MAIDSELLRGSLDLLVLSVLSGDPLYGYLIQQKLKESTGERVDLSASTLYPLLHRLESEKLVKAAWDDQTGRKRKWYSLTPAGRRALTQRARQWQDYADCLRQVLAPILDGGPKRIAEGPC
jgi:DNA-binding PadR family transcriptional regulator